MPILSILQINAQVPDWLDNLRRARSEALSRESVAFFIDEAIRHGKTH